MRKLILTIAAVFMASSAAYAEGPSGNNSTQCSDQNDWYHPTVNGVEVNYWNNRTCEINEHDDAAEQRRNEAAETETAMK